MNQKLSTTRSQALCGARRPLLLIAIVIANGLSACALAATPAALSATAPAALAPQQERITDAVIYRDSGVYRATQQRIKVLNDGGLRVADYQLSKAQCWLDVSFHEYTRNDRGNFPQEALSESQRILSALENRQDPGWETPLVNHAERLRPDLWARDEALKKHAGFQCATHQTACAEVELVHAGNEIGEAGWRHAKPYVQIAEDMTGAAEKAASECMPASVAAVAPPPVLQAKIVLSADALFRFDKSSSVDLLPKGHAELDQLAQQISAGGTGVKSLKVVGYTDRLGSVAYNLRLSQTRAETVKQYLQQRGVALPITTEGRGKQDQIEACANVKPQAELRACLQPNRRVEVQIITTSKGDN